MAVVIPCYGHAHLLADAIESVLAQTYPVAECLVVDDGSPDDVAGLVATYPGVRLLRQPNRGLAAARNAGLRAASSELIAFLDADDVLLPHGIAAGVAALAACPECAFAAGAHREVLNGVSTVAQPRLHGSAYETMLRSNFVGMHGAVLYRRAALTRAGGFDAALRACEDYDVYLRLLATDHLALHDTVVAEYRRRPGSLSRDSRLMFVTAHAALRRQSARARTSPRLWEAYRAGLAHARAVYGEALVTQVRDGLGGGPRGWARASRALATLASGGGRHYAARFVGALARRVLSGSPSQPRRP